MRVSDRARLSVLHRPFACITLVLLLLIALAPPSATPQATGGELITAGLDELTPELREQAKALGYKEGESVSLRLGTAGEMTVVPKVLKVETPQEIQARLLVVAAEKIVRKMSDDVTFSARADMDDAEIASIEVRTPFRLLQKPMQEEARGKGYAKSDMVSVTVDPKSWEAEVSAKPAASFSANLDEVVPGKNPGDPPVFRVVAAFDELPKPQQAAASSLGYERGSLVRLESGADGGGLKVLPQRFEIGMRSQFDKMNKKDQAEAAKLGYKPGETVWAEMTKQGMKTVPVARVGDGPWTEIIGAEITMDASGKMQMMPICVTRFVRLNAAMQKEALSRGYKTDDDVGLQYDPTIGKFTMLAPGQAQRMAQ